MCENAAFRGVVPELLFWNLEQHFFYIYIYDRLARHLSLRLMCVTCRLSCLDEELLLLRDREDIFWDMAEVRSSEPISLQAGQCRLWLVNQGHFSTKRRRGRDTLRSKPFKKPFSLVSLKNALAYLEPLVFPSSWRRLCNAMRKTAEKSSQRQH